MPKFKPGDKVVIIPENPQRQEWYGVETTVIKCTGIMLFYGHIGRQYAYELECGSPQGEGWSETALRLIPPKQQTTTWDACVWKPKALETS